MKKLPLPKRKPANVSATTWWRAKKRGYLVDKYHQKEFSYLGHDYLSEVVRDLQAFSGRQAKWVLGQWGKSVEEVETVDRMLSWDDLVSIGAMRSIELRSHPNGKNSWRFFAHAAMRAQSTALRHGKHRGKTIPLSATQEEPSVELSDSNLFFEQCLAIVRSVKPQAAVALAKWRSEGGEGNPPQSAMKILIAALRGTGGKQC